MQTICSVSQAPRHAGEEVYLRGWVHSVRDKSKLVFIELRDVTGIVQGIVWHEDAEALEIAKTLKNEDVIEISGLVNARPADQVKGGNPLGAIEIAIKHIKIINQRTADLPFEINRDDFKGEVKDDLRLEYRYLDLRRPKIKEKIILRSRVTNLIRQYLLGQDFYEIETPYLTKGTPEGAREFLVPSRLHKGEAYVLPQSPQQFKQMLMVAGFERYFQMARCFRDEDQRGDRQPEFTQVDIETSFLSQEEILNLLEKLFIDLVEKLNTDGAVSDGDGGAKNAGDGGAADGEVKYKISAQPFPRLTYAEAMEKYKSDKPDLRKDKNDARELAFCWIVDMPLFEKSASDGSLGSGHHPFTMPAQADDLLAIKAGDIEAAIKIPALAYDIVLNGYEIGGGSIRIHQADIQHKIFEILGLKEKEIQTKFGHMLKAFSFGTPPHGGIALGLDRLVMLLAGDDSIREVIPFPKTADARDLMTGAPAAVGADQLKDLGLKAGK